MIKKICSTVVLVLIISMSIIPVFVHADVANPSYNQQIKIDNPLKSGKSDLMSLITDILNNIVMPIAAVVSVVYIILAGFKYVTAQGNSTEISKANQNLMWALIGVGVLLGAAGISAVIQNTVQSFLN